jgi:hypothetical protein
MPAPTGGWTYEVVASPNADELTVSAVFPSGTGSELTVEDGAEPYLRDLEVLAGGKWVAVPPRGTSWYVECADGCRVRYRYLLREAGRANRHVTVARESAGAVEAPPSTWLLRPADASASVRFRFHVTSAPGEAFVSGVFPAGAKDTYEGQSGDGFQLPYAVFGKIKVFDLEGGKVQLALLPGRVRNESDVVAWVARSARAVEGYYKRFPVPRLAVIARPSTRDGVGFGTAIGNAGAAVAIDVGQDVTKEDLADDWVLVHEMIHTALPDLKGPHHWLEEGLSTYVEPLARARAGLVSDEELWRDWVRGMPNGEPEEGDRGLDRTPTWGRTYWGGALFCLVADVEIRTRTKGKKSLDDALRAIIAAGGNIATAWTMDRILEVGDAATGVPVLHEVYAKMARDPAPVDLATIWKRLGVVRAGGTVTFDDTAPLAGVRKAMTSG